MSASGHEDFGWDIHDSAPDPGPAAALLALMIEDRTFYRLPFDEIWDENCAWVLADVDDRLERLGWAAACRAPEHAWREAYSGAGSSALVAAAMALTEPD